MRGKVVGVAVKKCAPDKKWDTSATLVIQVDEPDAQIVFGDFYHKFTCEGKLLPLTPKDLIGKEISVSTNNGFVEDIFLRS